EQPPAPPPGYRPGYDPRYAGAPVDPYYADCRRARANNQAGGLIFGGLIGAGIGNAVSRGPQRGAGTAVGALLGALFGQHIGRESFHCDDENYIQRTYYDGFERGRPGASYDWRNEQSGDYGTLHVRDYYRDRCGNRCSNYSQSIYI